MQRAIHIFPEFENKKLIEEVRKKFDPLFGLVPPHITLVFPFESELPTSSLEQHVKNALVRLKSDIELSTALDDTESFQASFDTIVTHVTSEIIESNGDSKIEFIVSLS